MDRGPKPGVLTAHRDRLPKSSRYDLLVKIASGGMATVYVGRQHGVAGFSREVAIKRAHSHLVEEPSFATMLVAEATLASKIRHPNVVSVQAVEELEGELLLIMDYIEGASLYELLAGAHASNQPIPADVAVRVVLDASLGLHAAHVATDDDGRPLGIVHRDISPHNVLVGVDGIARLGDFGIAKASSHTESSGKTATGALKGKVSYMAPEYIERGSCDVRSDVFALGIVAWEALTSSRLFRGGNDVETLKAVLATRVPRPSEVAPRIGTALDDVVLRALARAPENRWPSALAFAEALESAARGANLVPSPRAVADFVKTIAGTALSRRRALIVEKKQHASESSMRVAGRADATQTLDLPIAERPSADTSEDVASPIEPAFATSLVGVAKTAPVPAAAQTPSAQMDTEPRHVAALPSRTPSRRTVIAGVLALAIVGGAAFGLRNRDSSTIAPASATATPATSHVPQPTVATDVAVTPVPDVSAAAARTAPSVPPPPSASASAPASAGAHAVPARIRPRAPITRAAASDRTPDRAPPNPYGRSGEPP